MLQVNSLHRNASCEHRSPTGAMDAMCQECHGLPSLGFLGSIAAHLVLLQVAQKKLHLISRCCCFLKERQVSFCPEGYCHWWFEIAAVRVTCCNKPPWPRCCPARDTICLWLDYAAEPSLQRNSQGKSAMLHILPTFCHLSRACHGFSSTWSFTPFLLPRGRQKRQGALRKSRRKPPGLQDKEK